VSTCPRCGEDVGLGQEYCLECGTRIPGPHLHGGQDPGRGWVGRALIGLAVAAAGAAVAVAAANETSGDTRILTATGGFASAPATATGTAPTGGPRTRIADWPALEDGWTIALASVPQAQGKKAATARARAARADGLETVGILDTSRYASLHPGYWLVFTGVYGSEAEATSSLGPAREFARTAVVRRVVP
jgi:hypothetical protein